MICIITFISIWVFHLVLLASRNARTGMNMDTSHGSFMCLNEQLSNDLDDYFMKYMPNPRIASSDLRKFENDCFEKLNINNTIPSLKETTVHIAELQLRNDEADSQFFIFESLFLIDYHIKFFKFFHSITKDNNFNHHLNNNVEISKRVRFLLKSHYTQVYLQYKRNTFFYISQFLQALNLDVQTNSVLSSIFKKVRSLSQFLKHCLLRDSDTTFIFIINNKYYNTKGIISNVETLRKYHVLQIYSLVLLLFKIERANETEKYKFVGNKWFEHFIDNVVKSNNRWIVNKRYNEFTNRMNELFNDVFEEVQKKGNLDYSWVDLESMANSIEVELAKLVEVMLKK
eukprot:GAHX01002946.1.p1 GENE.GAHX01002946.1~~GAHX01002946.1.p1  ORF type:complete len:343 (-),score=55.58 GAHX01002946.1:124-1152(-)